MKQQLFLLLTSAGFLISLGAQWNSAEKNQRLLNQAPGIRLVRMEPRSLLKEACHDAMKKWKGSLSESTFSKLQYAPPADVSVHKRFPRSISPYARIRGVRPDPRIIGAETYRGKARKSQMGLYKYCPFCCGDTYALRFDARNPDKAVTVCCRTELYRANYPADYKLKPNACASFRYLDDSVKKIPCTIYKDKEGNTWELFIHHLFDNAYWLKAAQDLTGYMKKFKQTGDPLYPYKAALILDHAADTYYALPLSFYNIIVGGKDGKGLSRAEWESLKRPIVFKHDKLGPWNRRYPFSSKGWINMFKEAIWCEPFALMRHHPAFRYYSKIKYGSEDALEKKILRKLIREIVLMYKSSFSQRLMTNYQEANYKDLLIAGILIRDQFIVDFAGANQELTLYNHHYQDGLLGEGAQNYMAMPGVYYYPYLFDPRGYRLLDKDFLKDNPFLLHAAENWKKLHTVRGLQLEFGDQHQHLRQLFPLRGGRSHLKATYEKIPSANYPGYGVGILRAGGKDQRLEISLHYSRAPLHNASDMLGISLWFDGVPVIRTGGYSSYWRNAPRKIVDELNKLNFPRKAVYAPPSGMSFPWLVSHSPIEQNTVTVNDIPPGRGWGDNRDSSEVVTYKGGESFNDPEKTFQVLEARALGTFKKMGLDCVREFRRALLAVETPGAKAYIVDLLTLHGGKNHTQFYSAWGDRVSGPAGKSKVFPTLTHAWFNGTAPRSGSKNKMISWWQNLYNRCFDHIRDVAPLHYSPEKPWSIQWNTDFYAYFRSADGKSDPPRPAGSQEGKVSVRMTSIPTDKVPTTLWQGKAPWSPFTSKHKLPQGRFTGALTIPFENAMDISMQRRTTPHGKDLESRFVQIFEGLHPGAKPVVKSVKKILSNRDQTVLEIQLAEGFRDIVIYQMKPGQLVLPCGISTDGRYAFVRKDSRGKIVRAHLVRGTSLRYKEKDLLTAPVPSYTGRIADITGDITGHRQRSEMQILPDQKWDLNALKDKDLHIVTTREDGHGSVTECYRIESARYLSNGRILIRFAHHAPFIAGWHQVMEINPRSPNEIRTNRPINKYANQPWYEGTKVLFPARNKTYVIRDTQPTSGNGGGTVMTLRKGTDLIADGIRIGDWYIIYSIEPGQKVYIPTCRSSAF